MFSLTKTSDGMKLLQWSKELPSASAADPLGLNLRVSARLSDELLYCITSITPRARYYSFFPWAFQDYNANEQGKKSDRGRIVGVLVRERAMVLGAVLHHGGVACRGGALGGSQEAETLAAKNRKTVDLASWEHLDTPQGQFGAAYKGSLINLGLFQDESNPRSERLVEKDKESEDRSDDSDTNQGAEVRELSALGKRLADSYARSIRHTTYIEQGLTLRSTAETKILAEFGAKAGLCEISLSGARDREVLREVFFARCPEMSTSSGHERRRMTLLLLLELVGTTREAGGQLDHRTFADICYFGQFTIESDSPKLITANLSPEFEDIQKRWQVFYTQNYLGIALQSLVVACVRTLRDLPAGLNIPSLLEALNPGDLQSRLLEVLGTKLTGDFLSMSAENTLSICTKDREWHSRDLDDTFSERAIADALRGGEASKSACLALATLLLYQVIGRFERRSTSALKNWYEHHVFDPLADIAAPGMIGFLEAEFGSQWTKQRNRELLNRILSRYVVHQHERMSYERGFGGSAPLFHVDGGTVIGAGGDFADPWMDNPRLNNALQILCDLGLIAEDSDGEYLRTEDGSDWLSAELQGRP